MSPCHTSRTNEMTNEQLGTSFVILVIRKYPVGVIISGMGTTTEKGVKLSITHDRGFYEI